MTNLLIKRTSKTNPKFTQNKPKINQKKPKINQNSIIKQKNK